MSVTKKRDAFICELQKGVKTGTAKKEKEMTDKEILKELERKFDELFGPLSDNTDTNGGTS